MQKREWTSQYRTSSGYPLNPTVEPI